MKKGKVLVLLLTVALTMTTVPSAYAADFADDVVADTVETEDTELPAETSEEVFPEISEEEHSEDQEDEIVLQQRQMYQDWILQMKRQRQQANQIRK